MSEIRDLEGLVFDKLTVVKQLKERAKNNSVQWECVCECGKTVVYPSYELSIGRHSSCGCSKDKLDVSVGESFGRLTTLYPHTTYSKKRKRKSIYWVCECECKNKIVLRESQIKKRMRMSCGCSKKRHKESHGSNRTPEYVAWIGMIERCYNVNHPSYAYYGARGVEVCNRWLNSYENFLEDMGRRPEPEYSLDRIDVNCNYEPNNCRWADKTTQSRNQRVSKANTSGFRGVNKSSRKYADNIPRWQVRISTDKGRLNLGTFKDFEEAVQVRKDAELKYWVITHK